MRDVTVAERKLNEILPDDDNDDGATSKRSSTASDSSLDVFSSDNNVGPGAASLKLAPGETPVTFTRRKSNSAERVTLDGSSLRLPKAAKTILA